MDDLQIKRIQILAEIDRLNKQRCDRCEGYNYIGKGCCLANDKIRALGKELLALRSPGAKAIEENDYKSQYRKWVEVAVANGISRAAFNTRVRVRKMPFEQAATQPLKKIKKKQLIKA